MGELRGALSSTVLRLDGEVAELRGRLERERARWEEAERLFGRLYVDHNAQVGALCNIYLQINDGMATIGLRPSVSYGTFDGHKLDHLTAFFRHLAEELAGLWLRTEIAVGAEGEWAASVVAARVLAGVHHHDPHFPVEVVLEDLDIEKRTRAERALAPYVEAVVRLEKETSATPEGSPGGRPPMAFLLPHSPFSSSFLLCCPFCLRGKKNWHGVP